MIHAEICPLSNRHFVCAGFKIHLKIEIFLFIYCISWNFLYTKTRIRQMIR